MQPQRKLEKTGLTVKHGLVQQSIEWRWRLRRKKLHHDARQSSPCMHVSGTTALVAAFFSALEPIDNLGGVRYTVPVAYHSQGWCDVTSNMVLSVPDNVIASTWRHSHQIIAKNRKMNVLYMTAAESNGFHYSVRCRSCSVVFGWCFLVPMMPIVRRRLRTGRLYLQYRGKSSPLFPLRSPRDDVIESVTHIGFCDVTYPQLK